MTDVLLINPPIEDFYQTEIRQFPLGLRYIQSTLEKAGFSVFLLDAMADSRRKTIPIPAEMCYLHEFYPIGDISPFKIFSHYYHFGMTYEKMAQKISQLNPRIIGISANFTPYFDAALEAARICKKQFPSVPVIMGGHHVTAVPESALESGVVDFVVLGEGEMRMTSLVKALLENNVEKIHQIDGIAFLENGKMKIQPPENFIENLDDFVPPPLKTDLATILTSRGCPKKCNFCSIHKVMGRRFRYRAIESIIAEMRDYISLGVRKFDFEDDHLVLNRERAKTLFQKIIENFSDEKLQLSAMNGILADSLDEELISLIKKAEFEWLNIPLVSGSDEVQRKIGRRQNRGHFVQVIKWARKYDLRIVAYLILGLPEDTLEQMIDDIIFLAQMPVLIGPSVFYPPPGAETFDNCVKQNYISGKDFSLYRSTAYSVETENFSRKDLVTLFRLVRLINYWKGEIDQKPGDYFFTDNSLVFQSENDFIFESDEKLSPRQIAEIVTANLIAKQIFLGVKKTNAKKKKFAYQFFPYAVSPGVINSFLAKIKSIKISGMTGTF